MTLLHGLRRAARRLGLDVQRARPARPAALLGARGVDLVLDVGANQGQYGAELRESGFDRRICSFEPLPAAYDALSKRAVRDPGWATHNYALGAEDGTATLNVAANEGASSSLLEMLPRHREVAPDADFVGAVEVPIRRLDSIWDDVAGGADAVFLKADVQGSEGAVLDGARDRLDEVIGLQLEISLAPLYRGAPSLRAVIDRVEALGMTLVAVDPMFEDPSSREVFQIDAIFMRPAR